MSSGEAGHEERPPSVAGPLDRHRRLSPCLSQTCSRAAEAGQAVRRRRGPPAPDDASPGSARRAGRWPARCSRRWCSQSCCRTTNGSILLVSASSCFGALWATVQLVDDLIHGGARDGLGERAARGRHRRLAARTTSRSPCSTGSSTAAAPRRAPTAFQPHHGPRLPAAAEPGARVSANWRPRFIDYLYLALHHRDRLQPDRRDAARALERRSRWRCKTRSPAGRPSGRKRASAFAGRQRSRGRREWTPSRVRARAHPLWHARAPSDYQQGRQPPGVDRLGRRGTRRAHDRAPSLAAEAAQCGARSACRALVPGPDRPPAGASRAADRARQGDDRRRPRPGAAPAARVHLPGS